MWHHLVKVNKSQKHFFLKLHCPKSDISFAFWVMKFQEKLLLRFTDHYLSDLKSEMIKKKKIWEPEYHLSSIFVEIFLSLEITGEE